MGNQRSALIKNSVNRVFILSDVKTERMGENEDGEASNDVSG